MNTVLVIAVNTFREAIRNRLLYAVVFFAALLVFGSALFGEVTIGDKGKVIRDFGLFSLSFFGVIVSIVAGVSLLSKEVEQKTIYNLLSKSVTRPQFLIGKFLGLALTSSSVTTLMAWGLIIYLRIVEGSFDPSLTVAIYFILLEVLILSAVVIFFSSMVVTPVLTGFFAISTFLAGRSITYLAYFLEDIENQASVLAIIVSFLDAILPDLDKLFIGDLITENVAIPLSFFLTTSAYALSYTLVLLLLSLSIFQLREFE